MTVSLHEHEVRLPSSAVRFPVELHKPAAFAPESPETWPTVDGRLEYVEGRILFMPPCGELQQEVVADIVYVLRSWVDGHPAFAVATNEAGMLLGGDVRAADAAIWRRDDAPRSHRYRTTAPVLAVEVAGRDEGEAELREKASWYLSRGVEVVWLVFPEEREVLVLEAGLDERLGLGEQLPEAAGLPELRPAVTELFEQVGR